MREGETDIIRSPVIVMGRMDLFHRHGQLFLSFKEGKLRLMGAKRPSVFRVPMGEVEEIRWAANGLQVFFEVHEQDYCLAFQPPMQWSDSFFDWKTQILAKFRLDFLMVLRAFAKRSEFFALSLEEANKWREILKETQ